ncbi:4853_t:CDS:2 [Acaulospora morrowiae]|uniref:4853_t:CDS:1 n=1 Tax=Acaulospora morrowiae TaxID=94023 RepID=A0A9N9H5J4_9GLOM|nr:4853_t:CDS:2 [Acaulospora morrowiae]
MSDPENNDGVVEQNMDSDVEEFELKLGSTFGAKNGSLPKSYYKLVYDSPENIDFSKATDLEFRDEETLQVSFCGDSVNRQAQGDEVQLLTGQRFEDYTEDFEEEDLEAEKQCLLIYDENSRTWTLECIDYSYKIGNDEKNTNKESPGSEYFEQKFESDLMQQSEEEVQELTEDENNEESDRFMNDSEIQINEENGHNDENGDEYYGEGLLSDDGLEEIDEPIQHVQVDQRENEVFEDEIIKDDGSESSGSSSSKSSTSTGTDSDDSEEATGSSDSDSDLEALGAQLTQEMMETEESKPAETRKNPTSLERKVQNPSSQPTSLAALFGGQGARQEEQDDSDSSSASD